MTRYLFIYFFFLRIFFENHDSLKFFGSFIELPSFETYAEDVAIEYYFEKVATYNSIFYFAIFLTVKGSKKRENVFLIDFWHFWQVYQFGSSIYNSVPYQFLNLSLYDFANLMERVVFMFLFELVTDLLIRWFVFIKMDINISQLGRNSTIFFLRVRFLFSIFLISLWVSVFYTLINNNHV